MAALIVVQIDMALQDGNLTKSRRARLLALMAERERYLRGQIAERRAALEHHAPASEPLGDNADLAFARTRAGIDSVLVDRYLTEVGAIEQARARLAAGSYETCVDCGDEIGWERLQANPAARRCAECQSRRERAVPGNVDAMRGR